MNCEKYEEMKIENEEMKKSEVNLTTWKLVSDQLVIDQLIEWRNESASAAFARLSGDSSFSIRIKSGIMVLAWTDRSDCFGYDFVIDP